MNSAHTAERPTYLASVAMPLPANTSSPHAVSSEQANETLAGSLYRFHGMQVLDAGGRRAGQIDWIWPEDGGDEAEFIGVGLRWLRGTALAVPCRDIQIDLAARTIRLPYTMEQLKGAPRLRIVNRVRATEKAAIYTHFQTPRARVTQLVARRRLAA